MNNNSKKCQECGNHCSTTRWSQITRSDSCDTCHFKTMSGAMRESLSPIIRKDTITVNEAHDLLIKGLHLPKLKYKKIEVVVSLEDGVNVKADFNLNVKADFNLNG